MADAMYHVVCYQQTKVSLFRIIDAEDVHLARDELNFLYSIEFRYKINHDRRPRPIDTGISSSSG